jgi:hypothetical protein
MRVIRIRIVNVKMVGPANGGGGNGVQTLAPISIHPPQHPYPYPFPFQPPSQYPPRAPIVVQIHLA